MSLHRFAVTVSVLLALVIAVGASVTTLAEFTPAQSVHAGSFQSIPSGQVHGVSGVFGALLVLVMAGWALRARQGPEVLVSAGAAGTLALISSAVGMHDQKSASLTLAVLHACLAPLILSLTVLVATFTASRDTQQGQPILLKGGETLRRAALAGPPLALIQIVFGVLYRHKVISVLLHMAGALVVSLLTLIVCVAILQQLTPSGPLKNSATAAMTVVLTQVSLGIAAFVMRLLDADTGGLFLSVTILHVTVGSLTLAATAQLAMNARCIGRAEDDQKIAFGESQ